MLNIVAVQGRLAADPELRTTPQGTSVATFRIGCSRNFARQGEQRATDWFNIVAWRQQAEFVSRYFHKGDMIIINGSLQSRTYQDKDGNNRNVVEIVADQLNFAGSRNEGGSSSSYSAPAQPNQAFSRPTAPEPSMPQFSNEDFAVIDDSEDLPF